MQCKLHRKLFALCLGSRLTTLHAARVGLSPSGARWCGRIASSDGVKYDPRSLHGLLGTPAPATGAELQQLYCAIGWMRASAPECTKLKQPLLGRTRSRLRRRRWQAHKAHGSQGSSQVERRARRSLHTVQGSNSTRHSPACQASGWRTATSLSDFVLTREQVSFIDPASSPRPRTLLGLRSCLHAR